MAYDQNKDKLIKLFELKHDKNSLLVSVFSYNNGDPKISIIRSYLKKDDTIGYSPSGRLNLEEVKFLKENIDEIIKIMEKKNK